MAVDSTGKVSPGDPFKAPPATIWNNMVDAGQAFSAGRLNSEPPAATRSRATDLLKLKNLSGAARNKGEILQIDSNAIGVVTAEHIWLDGIEPTTDCRFGILKYPADEDEVVTAQVSGVCMALVNLTDPDHAFAFAVDGEYVLQSGDDGPLEILYANNGYPADEYQPDGYSPEDTDGVECVVRFASAPVNLPDFIRGTIEGFNENTRVATVKVVSHNGSGAVPLIDDNDMLEVVDGTGSQCVFRDYTEDDLLGTGIEVWAHLVILLGGYDDDDRYWEASGMCCVPEE